MMYLFSNYFVVRYNTSCTKRIVFLLQKIHTLMQSHSMLLDANQISMPKHAKCANTITTALLVFRLVLPG